VQRRQRTWMRGAVTLAALAALTVGVLAAPGGAAGTLTRAKVKKIATRVANKVVDAENAIVSKNFADGDIPGNSGFDLNNPNTIMGSLSVPAGNWAFHADFEIARINTGIIVICEMRAGTDTDSATTWIPGSQTQTSVSLQTTAAFPSGGTVDVRCDDGTAATTDADFSGLEIVAIEGSTLTAS
jgi:hypothetical protein